MKFLNHRVFYTRGRKGITLLLTMSMLGGLVLVAGAAANLIITVTRSSRSIGDSEIAYFAAETAVEKALLKFEKQSAALGALNTSDATLLSNPAAHYTTSAAVETHAPKDDTRLSVPQADNPISDTNQLTITLIPGQRLYMDLSLDLTSTSFSYPNNIQINFPANRVTNAITYSGGAQEKIDYAGSGTNFSQVTVGSLGVTNKPRLKIESATANTANAAYTITPSGGNLPIGVIITGVGRYHGVERRIEVFRPNYIIY